MIFNEDELFSGNVEDLKDDLLHTTTTEFMELIERLAILETRSLDVLPESTVEDDIEFMVPIGLDTALDADPLVDLDSQCVPMPEQALDAQEVYPTPEQTPPVALLAYSIRQTQEPICQASTQTSQDNGVWQAAFNAGRLSAPIGTIDGKTLDKAQLHRRLLNGYKPMRSELPPVPKRHSELASHPFGDLFIQAELQHLQTHKDMNSWTEIDKSDPQARGEQVIQCMWVYTYKFDKHGRFQKCKARLVVRGDQQRGLRTEDTYAATLAGRSFRVLMAIAAKFDLELIQFDVVNAFVNATLPYVVFMTLPPGYRTPGKVLRLNKALYGLRISPLLWQKEFSSTLQSAGYSPIPHEPYCYTKDGILIFFYVDDIVIAYPKGKDHLAQALVTVLRGRYNLTGGNELQWFLGIEVVRDRPRRLIWLSQLAYITKISQLVENTSINAQTPMGPIELFPRDGIALAFEISRYQRKIGSILYAAVNTRPDIAFAASRLARFLTNPGPAHQTAADQVLLYLERTWGFGLQLGGDDDFIVYSNASFADNTINRKSSQAYAMKLFRGLIGWRANKQPTVTTSTTEAELLALSQAAKEALYISWLIIELSVQLDDSRIQILCDNKQTIRLVTAEIALLQTKLRYIDIHNHWLR